jgi:hypothetical protein
MDIETIAKNHASVIADINAGLIVDHGDTVGIEFSADGKSCLCADCQAYQTSLYLESHKGEQ